MLGRAFLTGAALFGSVGMASADSRTALPPVVGATEVFATDELSGLALRGFDPVSYHLGPAPRPGQAGIELIWSGVVWRFANEGNRAAFERDPTVYAPRLGGYDPIRAAEGTLIAADPTVFVVRGSRVYVFRSKETQARFLADPSIQGKAEARWLDLSRDLVQP